MSRIPANLELIEECQVCGKKIEFILDKKGFVVEGWCSKCGIMFDSEELLIEKIKQPKKIWEYFNDNQN